MKASWNWLRTLVPALPPQIEETAAAARLTLAGLEVEALIPFGPGLESVVIAQVIRAEQHPIRPDLQLVTVRCGHVTSAPEERVVCGASNVPPAGGLVAFAPLGTYLAARRLTLEQRTIAGIASDGMLCSQGELGIGSEEDGILVLPPGSAKPGQRLIDALPSAYDTILELNLTPNRPDALGHVGLARELAALFAIPFSVPQAPAGSIVTTSAPPVRVELQEGTRCSRYGVGIVRNVSIGPSPLWLRHRLFSLGVRPISNVVDITNLLLLEFGQPLHAFDLSKVQGDVIHVRCAHQGEQLQTLDGQTRTLSTDDLVIADRERPLALAGVMGGASTEITAQTQDVLIECAYFEPRSVRRTARRHGMHTEASHRFERGVDPNLIETVLTRALALMAELAAGTPSEQSIHDSEVARSWAARSVPLRAQRMDHLLGAPVPWNEAIEILTRLGCTPLGNTSASKQDAPAEKGTHFAMPSWRPDLLREVDLIEEVARVRGLDAIPAVLPTIRTQSPSTAGALETRVRTAAVELGLCEAITYAFVAPRELQALESPTPAVVLENPLTEERSVMRTSLLPGLLEAIAHARRHGERTARLFSVGRVFLAPASEQVLPTEKRAFAAVLAGPRPTYLARAHDYDVFDAKGVALEVTERVTGHTARVEPCRSGSTPPHLHPRGAAKVHVGEHEIGQFGPLHPDVVDALALGGPLVIVELSLDALEALGRRVPKAAPIARLPAVTRDISVVVHDDIPAGEVELRIREAAGELCAGVELFDLFRGGSIPQEHRSLAFHVVYRDPKATQGIEGARTLTDAEVDERHHTVMHTVHERLGATLRTLPTSNESP